MLPEAASCRTAELRTTDSYVLRGWHCAIAGGGAVVLAHACATAEASLATGKQVSEKQWATSLFDLAFC